MSIFNQNKYPGPCDYEAKVSEIKESSKNYSIRTKDGFPQIFQSTHNPGPGHCKNFIIQIRLSRIPRNNSSTTLREKVPRFTQSKKLISRTWENCHLLVQTLMKLLSHQWVLKCSQSVRHSNLSSSQNKSAKQWESLCPAWVPAATNTSQSSGNEKIILILWLIKLISNYPHFRQNISWTLKRLNCYNHLLYKNDGNINNITARRKSHTPLSHRRQAQIKF